jgi:hypothetical protein
MRFSTIIALVAFVVIAAIASPVHEQCRHPSDAETIVARYIAILSHGSSDLGDANATAQALLDDRYTEISDSVLSLKGLPVSPPSRTFLSPH